MNLGELRRALRPLRALGRLPVALLAVMLMSIMAVGDGPIASSSFVGAENPLSENGTWVSLTAYSPYGTVFQKNNGAYPDRLSPLNHAGSRTTAVVPADHYSEIVDGHIGSCTNCSNNVGALVRVQTDGAAAQSNYLWWASLVGGGNYLYRLDANVPDNTPATTYTATALLTTSPVVDGDRLRLIARGQVIYGVKNGVRDFIYNTGTNPTKYSTGTTGIFAYADAAVTNAVIASWSTGAAPVSTGAWASSTFPGTENPLDEGDRWYSLPGYLGFKKVSGQAMGLQSGHNAEGVWSIAPPATQYSEVTLGAVAGGGGGPIVRIDRNNPGQTGWLLFLYAGSPSSSGIYKMTPDGGFTAVQLFTPTIISGDKWRLTANGNTLEVFQNGVSQFKYTTDGSYPTGDVGIEAYTPAFTFSGWEGGDIAGGTGAPTITSFTPTSGTVGTNVAISGTNFTGATAVTFNGVSASFIVNSATAIQATVPAGATTRPLSGTTPGGTAASANSFTVTIQQQVATPSFSPGGGTYTGSVTVTISDATSGAAIHYTTDGSTPTTSSPVYGGALTFNQTTTLKAMAAASGMTDSGVASATYTIQQQQQVATPTFSQGGGTYTGSVTVTISDATSGAAIHYTTDGSTPTTSPPVYGGALTFNQTTTLKAMAAASGMTDSGVASATYTIQQFFTLSVSTTDLGSGTVTSSPAGIDCGSNCSASYVSGTTVPLTATPDLLSGFGAWSECDSVSGNTCTVKMNSARSVTADFKLLGLL